MRVVFYRSALASDSEKPFKMPLLSVTCSDTVSRDDAVSDAVETFEAQFKVSSWQRIAEFYEVYQ